MSIERVDDGFKNRSFLLSASHFGAMLKHHIPLLSSAVHLWVDVKITQIVVL
jgi:hypothetical protein